MAPCFAAWETPEDGLVSGLVGGSWNMNEYGDRVIGGDSVTVEYEEIHSYRFI